MRDTLQDKEGAQKALASDVALKAVMAGLYLDLRMHLTKGATFRQCHAGNAGQPSLAKHPSGSAARHLLCVPASALRALKGGWWINLHAEVAMMALLEMPLL